MTRSALTRLVAALPAQVGRTPAVVLALGFDRCQLGLERALPAGEPVVLVLRAHDEREMRFNATPGEAHHTDGGVEQIAALVPSTPQDADALDGIMTGLRKDAHLALCAHDDVQAAAVTPGWDDVVLHHVALPELDAAAIDPTVELWGKTLQLPLIIGGMTGGSRRGADVNRSLATVAQDAGIAMGVGSQRRMLQDPDLAWTYQVRDMAPDILLLANIGAVQLNYGVTAQQCVELVEAIGADVLCIHLNALQERVQPEGELDFSALLERVREVVAVSSVPVVLKETGCGLSARVTRQAAREEAQAGRSARTTARAVRAAAQNAGFDLTRLDQRIKK